MKARKIHKTRVIKAAIGSSAGRGAEYEALLAKAQTYAQSIRGDLESRVARVRARNLNEGGLLAGQNRTR